MKEKTPKKMGAVSVKKTKAAPLFTIKITTEHGEYDGSGATALDALKAIPAIEVVTSSTVVITHGKESKEMVFSGQQIKRLLNPYNMEVLINDLQLGM